MLVFLELPSLGLIRFPREYRPLSCLEGKGIAASLYEVLILIIQHVYDHVPPGLFFDESSHAFRWASHCPM